MAAIAAKNESITTFCVYVTKMFSTSDQFLDSAAKIFQGWRSEPEQTFKEIFKEAEQLTEELGESIRPP